MDLNQAPRPSEGVDHRKRISGLWSSGNRTARLLFWGAAGLVLNCCCLIIPLWDSSGGRWP